MNLHPSCANHPEHHSRSGQEFRKDCVGLLQSHLSKTKEQLRSSQAIVKEDVSNCRWLGTQNKTEFRNWCGDTETQHGCTYENTFSVTEYTSLAGIFMYKAMEQLLPLEGEKMD